MLRRQAFSHRSPAGQSAAPAADTVLDSLQAGGGRHHVAVEKGQSYALTDPSTGRILAVKKVERIGKSLHVTLHDDQTLELHDFFVSLTPHQGMTGDTGTAVQPQAQFVFYTGTAGCTYGVVDALVPPSHWGPLEGSRTLWGSADADFCPAWTSPALGGLSSQPAIDAGVVPYLGDGLIAVAALLSTLKGGSTPAQVAVLPDLLISGNAALGPVLAGNDLRVTAYDASGHTLGSSVGVDASGHYSLTVQGGYKGVVTLRLTSAGSALDYVSEAPVVGSDDPQDLRGQEDLGSGALLATSVATGGASLTMHITPLTDLASRVLMVDPTSSTPALKAGLGTTDVGVVNRGVAGDFLGSAAQISSGVFQDITTLDAGQMAVNTDLSANPSAGLYGLELLNLAYLAASQGALNLAQSALLAQTRYDPVHQTLSSTRMALSGGALHSPVTYAENGTAPVLQLQLASTTGFSNVSYLITGGADALLFDIDHDTGEISFLTPPQAQNPLDANHDNSYQLIVTAQATVDANPSPITASQMITVQVNPVLGP